MLEEELDEFRLALRQYMECACAQTGCLQSVDLLCFAIQNHFIVTLKSSLYVFIDVQSSRRWIIAVMVFDLCS